MNTMNKETNEPIMYDVKDLMRILKMGKNPVYSLVKNEGFPAIKIGGRYRVEESALRKWMDTYKGRTFDISD